jgi:hypothetical protein
MFVREFIQWQCYEHLEPGEPRRGDYRAALITHEIAASAGTKNLSVEDFLLKFEERTVETPAINQARIKQNLILGMKLRGVKFKTKDKKVSKEVGSSHG